MREKGTDLFSEENKSVPFSRRDVVRGIAGGVAAAALPSAAFAVDVLSDDAVPDLRILSGVGGNVVVLSTRDGQIVVDSGDAESSKVVISTLRTLGDGKVAVLVNTHWHPAQTGANGALKGGQHVELPEYTPFSNLLLTIINKAGLDMKSIGDSTGEIAGV